MLSHVLAANSIATYIWYIRATKIMINYKGVLLLLGKLGKSDSPAKMLCITPPYDQSVHKSLREYMLIIIQGAAVLVENKQKAIPFHRKSFYKHARALLDELHVRYFEQEKERVPTFALFVDIKI